MARKREATDLPASAPPQKKKKARTKAAPSPSASLPADPTDTPYKVKLSRASGTTALKLSIRRVPPTIAHHYNCIDAPEDGQTWRRGDIGELAYDHGDVGRVMVLDIVQEDSPDNATKADTFFAVAWLYTKDDAQAAGIRASLSLETGKTHIMSTHVQMVRYGGFTGAPLSSTQRSKEIVDDRILDFGVRPPKVRSLASKGCQVVDAIQYAREYDRQEKQVMPKRNRKKKPRPSLYDIPISEEEIDDDDNDGNEEAEEDLAPAQLSVAATQVDLGPQTPPPEYATDDPSTHATPLDPRISSPVTIAADHTFNEPDAVIADLTGSLHPEGTAGTPAMFSRLRQSIAGFSPFKQR